MITGTCISDIPWYEKEDWELDELKEEFSSEDKGCHTPSFCDDQVEDKQKSTGAVYPVDLWFVLSCYITPQQVQTFALICQGANAAVSSKKFWIRLYWRHCVDPWSLPDRLHPDRIDSRPGLKSRVIRALFHSYEPLRGRLLHGLWQTEGPDWLQFMHCCSLWFKQILLKKNTKVWAFYFRFMLMADRRQHRPRYLSKEWFEKADFVKANPELNYCMLQVNCLNFVAVPHSVIGQILTGIFINISQNMRHNCVKMVFHKFRNDGKYHPCDGMIVTLDPAIDYRVMKWWHPSYPHHADW